MVMDSQNSSNTRKIALLMETNIRPGRDMIRGIHRYAREGVGWVLHHDPSFQVYPAVDGYDLERIRTAVLKWQCDGVMV